MPNGEHRELWYRLAAEQEPRLSKNCDPLLVGALSLAMQMPADLHVHGTVSPSLLKNLEEYMRAWSLWEPRQYARIEILPEVEQEHPRTDTQAVVSAFSGGVDASFTVWRHCTGYQTQWPYKIGAGLFVHGFIDTPLPDTEGFQRAFAKAQLMMDSLGVELIPMASNIRQLIHSWEETHGIATAACLMVLQGGYSKGLLPSSNAYPVLVFPWGSNPLTDTLIANTAFNIVHDGLGYYRPEKVHALAQWPEALQNLRVCLKKNHTDHNCCGCEKCIRTILDFRAAGLGLPPSFSRDVTHSQIIRLHYPLRNLINEYKAILDYAKRYSQKGSWTKIVQLSIAINETKYRLLNSSLIRSLVPNRLKHLFTQRGL